MNRAPRVFLLFLEEKKKGIVVIYNRLIFFFYYSLFLQEGYRGDVVLVWYSDVVC
jgi:hypothetical protein